MALNPLLQALETICQEKNISKEVVIQTLESALAAAYRKDYGEPNQNIKVEFDADTGEMKVFDVKIVMEKPPEEEFEENANTTNVDANTANTIAKPVAEGESSTEFVEEKPRFNPKLHLTPEEAQILKPGIQIGEEIRTTLTVPSSYGRMAAQTAKQVIMQKLREAERAVLYDDFKSKEHTVVTGVIQRREGRAVLVDFGKLTALMLPEGQAPHEQYRAGERVKVYVESVELKARGAEVIVSRTTPELVRQLFMVEIPEIQHESIEIMGVAREAGSRVKISVKSLKPNIDPVGSCVGQRGARVQTIIHELSGEKIDIIEWAEDPAQYLKNALSPAKTSRMDLDEVTKTATVYVVEDQLSLAIGRNGQNVRLASRLTGWNIDIKKAEAPVEAVEEAPAASEESQSQEGSEEKPDVAMTNS